ncbi:hypothetical protein [Pelobium manganitolerans]|uniref:hypothetical protein n=1 Tax=Pelobium manganitolerans TaxID=1842495 RepID=UPI003FA398C6
MNKHANLMGRIVLFSLVLLSCNDVSKQKKIDHKEVLELSKQTTLKRSTVLKGNLADLQLFVDSLSKLQNVYRFSKDSLDSVARILYNSMKIGFPKEDRVIADSNYVKSSAILKSIKLSQQVLNTSDWKHKVSSEDFWEYIAPYKLTNEIFDQWKDSLYCYHQNLIRTQPKYKNLDSLYRFHITETYNRLSSKVKMRNLYPAAENYSWLKLVGEGDCISRCRYAIYHLRAAGAPATFDYIPHWGNRPHAEHAYVGLANKQQQVDVLLGNNNNANNLVDNLNAAMSPKKTPRFYDAALPKGIYVQYEKTIPKIYRQTWNEQQFMTELIKKTPKDERIINLIKPNMLDVSKQYLNTADVHTRKSILNRASVAYLATFDVKNWIPVAFSTFNWWGNAKFTALGKNVLFLPVVYNNSALTPYDKPFYVDSIGVKHTFVCNKWSTINLHLRRKFPLFSYTAAHAGDLRNCRIEGANDADFRNATVLHTVQGLTFNTVELNFKSALKFRYIRMVAPEGGRLRLTELQCFSHRGKKIVKLLDENYRKGILKGQKGNAFDNDYTSYYVGNSLVMDFGTPKTLSKIRFTPLNDANYIIPGYQYELFYWDDHWISAGRRVAKNDFLNYSNIPSNTVYLLKCLTAGTEERIFTYQNDTQIWW